MIFGIGVDIVSIKRIEQTLNKFGESFIDKILSLNEKKILETKKNKVSFLAKRFAAKEAVVKALGTGFQNGIKFHEISILNDDKGKPFIKLEGELLKYILDNKITKSHISISDEKEYAVVNVILEC